MSPIRSGKRSTSGGLGFGGNSSCGFLDPGSEGSGSRSRDDFFSGAASGGVWFGGAFPPAFFGTPAGRVGAPPGAMFSPRVRRGGAILGVAGVLPRRAASGGGGRRPPPPPRPGGGAGGAGAAPSWYRR